ncbi:MAG: hypothetical protein QXW01_02565 [Candidatus Aenigmatarchaeota archaeon]
MKEKVKIIFGKGNCYVLFRGISYTVDCSDIDEIIEKIKYYEKKYRETQKRLIEEAASLGVIILAQNIYGENLFQAELNDKVEKLIKKYSKKKNYTIEKFS